MQDNIRSIREAEREAARNELADIAVAMLDDDHDHDPRVDRLIEIVIDEIFDATDNLDRQATAAERQAEALERQAEALERIHARLGFGLVDAEAGR